MRRAPALCADLHDALVLAGGGKHCLSFRDINADGFLAIDIGSSFHSLDHVQCMPMVGRADENNIEILLLEHLAIVMEGSWLLLRYLASSDHISRSLEHLFIHITKGDDLHRSDLD